MTAATPDRRAAILARCDELEAVAKAVLDSPEPGHDDTGEWEATGSGVVTDLWMRRVISPAPPWISTERSDALGTHVATWSPTAVFALIAGARAMCEIHKLWDADEGDLVAVEAVYGPEVRRGRWCQGCGGLTSWPCPTLAALARMLGVENA